MNRQTKRVLAALLPERVITLLTTILSIPLWRKFDVNQPFLHKLKSPKALAVIIAAIGILILFFDVLEDTLTEGAPITFPLMGLWNMLSGFVGSVTLTVSSWGYVGVFVLMLLESSSLPIPSEIILPFAGYLASLGELNFWVIVIASTIAGMIGALIDYAIGRKGAELIIKSKTGKILLSDARLQTVKNWYDKHPVITVFVSRLIPGFRTLASFPAGAVRMQLKEFITYTLAGCLLWNTSLTYLGVYVGENWSEIAGTFRYIIIGFSLALALGIAAYLLLRRKPIKR